MPYIKRERRPKVLNPQHRETIAENCEGPGDLNYTVTSLIHSYIKKLGLSYKTINEVMGVLACVQQELYRRLSFYEDQKIRENGDIEIL